MRNDERILRILHEISLRSDDLESTTGARRAFVFLKRQKPGEIVEMNDAALGLSLETLAAVEREVNTERLLFGEETPERTAFLEMRADVQKTIRELRARGDRERIAATLDLIPDREKREMTLFQEANKVLQDVAAAMGIRRPIVLELTRESRLNAFVLNSEREGVSLDDASASPMHVYVSVGLFSSLDALLQERAQTRLTVDHFAGIVAHELQHLRQPEYNSDKPPEDKVVARRFEYDADLTAMDSMDRAGYNPMALVEAFEAITRPHMSPPSTMAHYFAGVHPLTENRVKDLKQELNRSDRVFWSANVNEETGKIATLPFSEGIYGEIEGWNRESLLKILSGAIRWSDWEEVAGHLERDPNATFLDAEMAISTLKVQLEARAVLSEAAHELRTGELGLRDALLYSANAQISGRKVYLNLWNRLNGESGSYGEIPSYGRNVLSQLSEDAVALASHEDPGLTGCIRLPAVKKLLETIYVDTFLVPKLLPDGPFKTIDDLTRASSEQADKFWQENFPTSTYDGAPLPADRSKAMLLLVARLLWRKN